ncbi:MAG: phosphotransferase [Desulfobacterium sp.]|nr:phosphotransferase [Desulfobacterium sp.]MBU3948490.1 phosphotransferase [Pseudomonadota bacterium]MBU4009288.1 phosphotransferase [Pseudomonadota bacterium]MBU4036009.1 phosphotransferase [Pseudomonadota bacterium]
MSYRVCIPMAGTGTRLGELTKYVNKSLVTVANQPVISHVINQFPMDAEFVIALGYKGDLAREYLEIAYPTRIFIFVNVDPYEGPVSGLGYTLLCCRQHLQQPFVFCSNDTIVTSPCPAPDHNWMSYASVEDITPYRTLRIRNGQVTEICEKGVAGNDLEAYIGLTGINDHDLFWNAMEQGGTLAVQRGESYGMGKLIDKGILAYPFEWYDTGNTKMLERVRVALRKPDAPNILDKSDEAIWFVNGTVIKFSADSKFIQNRVKRSELIGEYCPQVINSGEHMYQYREVKGRVVSEVVNLPLFRRLLEHSKRFWKTVALDKEAQQKFQQTCLRFYRDKTQERIQLFYKRYQRSDGTESINGESMPMLRELLDSIDWSWMSDGLPGRFHGDFHFENILYSKENDHFTFLDWRQDFGGSLTTGDIYYDLAKLLHGLIISHELIARDLFKVEWKDDEILYAFHRKQVLVECERLLNDWLVTKGYNLKKVRVLTALIYLNIAALHHYPYCMLLYALGKRMLKEELEKH